MSQDIAFFRKLDEFHLASNNRKDMNKILAVLDEDFIEITSHGKVEQYADYAHADSLSDTEYQILDYNIKIIAPGTVLSYYKLKNQQTGVETMRSNIWKKENDTWKMIFHQGTIIAE